IAHGVDLAGICRPDLHRSLRPPAGFVLHQLVTFSPMMPATITRRHRILAGVAGSPRATMPTMDAPAAPMPVQTAYAVPTGTVFMACAGSAKLAVSVTSVTTLGTTFVQPSVNLRPTAQTISRTPAITSSVHAMAHHLTPRPGRCQCGMLPIAHEVPL